MPIDPSIPLQVQPLKLETPMNTLAMASEVMKMGEYQQTAQEKNAIRNRMAQGNFDLNNLAHRQELSTIAPTIGPKFMSEMASTNKNIAQTQEATQKIDSSKRIEAVQRIVGAPDAATAANILQSGMADGSVPVQHGTEMLKQLSTMPYPDWQMNTIRSVVKPETLYTHGTVGAGTQATLKQAESHFQQNKAQVDATGALTPDSITNAAARYNIDGTLPPLGMGAKGATMRSQILNEAAVQAKNSGVSPEDQRIAQIGNAANKSSLTQLSKSEAMVGAFEKNFNKNADLALKQSTVVDSTGIPIVNSWINAGKRSVTGDPKLSAYDTAIKATVNEYAKIISGSMGNTATALAEIKKVNELLAAAQTPAQVEAVIGMMKQETQNRMTGFKEQKAELTSGMKGKKNNANPSSPSVAPPSGFTID